MLNLDQWKEIPDKMKKKSRGKVVLRMDKEEPWEMIKIMQKYGQVPELHPQPTASRARGHSTQDILKIYYGNRELQKRIRRESTSGGKKDRKKKSRATRTKALQAAQAAQVDENDADAEPDSDSDADDDVEIDDAGEL